MCRICGRMVKCIFDSMPSRTLASISRSVLIATRSSTPARQFSSKAISQRTTAPKTSPSRISTTYNLPIRSHLHQATATAQAATGASHFQNTSPLIPPTDLQPSTTTSQTISTTSAPSTNIRSPIPPTKPLVLSKSVQTLLPALHAQSPHYITAHIHRFPYLVTTGDLIRLPFHMPHVSQGDVLRLNRASVLGSRDLTLKAGMHHTEVYDQKRTGEPNYLDERLFECRARVMGVESQPMIVKEKKKRRNRKVRTAKSKLRYTVLRVMEVRVKSLEELMGEEGYQLVLE